MKTFKVEDAFIKTFNSYGEEVNFIPAKNSYSNRNTIFKLNLKLDNEKQITLNFYTGSYDFRPSILSFSAPSQMIENHNLFSKNLIGKIILLNQDIDKIECYHVKDFDVIKSINEKLEKLKDPETISLTIKDYPLYEVLKSLNFKINSDKRISIKILIESKEKEFLINKSNYIISKEKENDFYLLTPDNIKLIYDEFFKNNFENSVNIVSLNTGDDNPDHEYKYYCDEQGLCEKCTNYNRSGNGRISHTYILLMGEILPERIAEFIDKQGYFKKGYYIQEDKLFIY